MDVIWVKIRWDEKEIILPHQVRSKKNCYRPQIKRKLKSEVTFFHQKHFQEDLSKKKKFKQKMVVEY